MLKFINNIKLSRKMIYIISIFLITFFSINISVNAANFKYSDFDFDEFAENNLGFWTSSCASSTDDDEKCTEKVLESQREFYTRLYKILAKYERKGVKFNSNSDNIIIATVFYDISIDMFNDNGVYYKEVYGTDKNVYNYDDTEDIDSYDPDNDDGSNEVIAQYFANETDTLKLLIKSMIGYQSTCIGYKEGTYENRKTTINNEDGTVTTKVEKILVCDNGQPTNGLLDHEVCAATVSTGFVGAWDQFAANSKVLSFFGIKSDSHKQCNSEAAAAGFNSNAIYKVERTQKVDENYYWQFLIDGDYFDKKPHLQSYFATVLKNAGVESMEEFYNTASSEVKSENEEEIKKARTQIVDNIKAMLHDYNGYEVNGGTAASYTTAGKTTYWWPIGSVETTEENGKTFAAGEPESSSIYRDYGTTRDDVSNEYNKNYGIEIIANDTLGATNIIAVSTGTVSEVNNNCKSNDDKECGSGYGNYVVITHPDGNYTLYGHLHENTITVNIGDNVSQGQVIGKMGASGKINRTSLYFEVRTGASKTNAVNPNDYVSIDNARSTSVSSDFMAMLLGLEGTGNIIGDSYQVYCNAHDIPTVGIGVTLSNHYEKFAALGYTLTPPYSNYCGKTIPISIVDQVQAMIIEENTKSVQTVLASAGLNLNQQQVEALTILDYNAGNINGFVEAYNSYGSTDALCTNWWVNKSINSAYASALTKRRQKECQLFVHGIYDGTYS